MWQRFFISVGHAWRGLRRVWSEEQNFRLQAMAAVVVLALMFYLDLSTGERAMLVLAVAFVLVLELLNSVIERLVDFLKPRLHGYVGEIKDMAAAMVLVASIGAAVIGWLIFWPHLVKII
jgi:diacylglycerol kinase